MKTAQWTILKVYRKVWTLDTTLMDLMQKEFLLFLPDYTVEEEFAAMSQLIDWGLKQSRIPETWKVSEGEGVRVLVIDTGHPVHSDLDANTEIGENFILDEGHEDFNGHQTHWYGNYMCF